jgi:hypothetical protein
MPLFIQDATTAKNVLAFCMGFPGILCMLAPRPVLQFALVDPLSKVSTKDEDLTVLIFRCFGSQALLVGTVLYSAETLGASGFRAFAGAMIPYLAFNTAVLARVGTQLKTIPNLCDMLNNVVMLGAAMIGYKFSTENKRL